MCSRVAWNAIFGCQSCVTLSSALSATYQSAQLAADAVKGDIDVRVVDSRAVTIAQGLLAIAGAQAAAAGKTLDEVEQIVAAKVPNMRVFAALDTLENLKKGGRIGGAQALLGSMLSIKPLVDLSTGTVEEAGRTRTRKKAFAWLRDTVARSGEIENLRVIHGEAPDIDEFLAMLTDVVDLSTVQIGSIGPVIGTHGGPRVVGVAFHVKP